jgi:tripartite-type tricarboxylate transporter receptor subunit TctC
LTGLLASGLALHDTAETLWAKDYHSERKLIWPKKKIIWVVPVKPSKGLDTLVRFLSTHLVGTFKELRPTTGGDIIIDNVPGGEGTKAYAKIFEAAPDGYTFGDFNPGVISENLTSKPPVHLFTPHRRLHQGHSYPERRF